MALKVYSKSEKEKGNVQQSLNHWNVVIWSVWFLSSSLTSSVSGNRCDLYFENTMTPSATTSNIPLPSANNSISMSGKNDASSADKLSASGR